eukprot:gene14696-10509_t
MVIFGYHGRGDAKREMLDKCIYRTAAAREVEETVVRLHQTERTKALAKRSFEVVVDLWAANGWNGPVPVQGYNACDSWDLDKEALERTLIPAVWVNDCWTIVREEPCEGVQAWKELTGRDQSSFERELRSNRYMARAEKEEVKNYEMHSRDRTNMPRAKKSEAPESKEPEVEPKKEKQPMTGEWLLAALKRKEQPDFSTKRSKNSPVSRHAVAGRVTQEGDVVLLDPSLDNAHLVSRNDLTSSVSGILSCFVDHWAVYEFRVDFIEPL